MCGWETGALKVISGWSDENSSGLPGSVGTMNPFPELYYIISRGRSVRLLEENSAKGSLTFMMATCPVDRGVVNAGLSPPELMVSIGLERRPSLPMRNDCRPPDGFSFTALWRGVKGP